MKRLLLLLLLTTAWGCTEYTPKPRGYMRIEPPAPSYHPLALPELPFDFYVSQYTQIELAELGDTANWINVAYPTLGAKLYGSFFHLDVDAIERAIRESNELMLRQLRYGTVDSKAFDNPDNGVFATLSTVDGLSPSPLRFIVTDGESAFFTAALYFHCVMNPDSLAPAIQYIQRDVEALIESFTWKLPHAAP
ncbi:gliding motility protein GldD [Parabacteroides sp. OttesenSCG-928-N08]|nr:gliding motility protein GldD [Parabacteroides sp. OttesenSCG-928-N08]